MQKTKTFNSLFITFNCKAFTLAEVLITLGIIGVVCAMTIPTLMKNTQDNEFKTAYKKAYSEINQVFMQAIQEQSFTPRTAAAGDSTATAAEWDVIKAGFKIAKECDTSHLSDCWADADTIWGGPSLGTSSYSFIDTSGRTWAEGNYNENIYLVDTNGLKPPNRFGKDRWIFTSQNADGSRLSSGYPAKIGPLIGDQITSNAACLHPPCYYQSWLYDN